ncbi:hypothetical protein MNBD_GAMMA01-1311 [hydrothermal vent metagenome]|uniref:Uncharacterized protein n=1 Tax=hydrothermal vent metagenome TaxID=652676 RepID=A0A3B0VKN2_9ZZZZ
MGENSSKLVVDALSLAIYFAATTAVQNTRI